MRTIDWSYYKSRRKLESELISPLLVLQLRAGEFMYSSCLHDGSETAKIHGSPLMSTLKDGNLCK
jgi:hypothetical protein